MTAKNNMVTLMRAHKVTVRDLASRMNLTLARVRELRNADRLPYLAWCDMAEAITGRNVFDRGLCDRYQP